MSAIGDRSGRCACGAIRFVLTEAPSEVIACHCATCRRWSGYLWAAIRVPRDQLSITTRETLRWWAASAGATRGFCAVCGSSLFFDEAASPHIGVAPGALDDTTGLRTMTHICVVEASDYARPDPNVRQFVGPDPGD